MSVLSRRAGPGYHAGMHELFEHTADLGLRATAPGLDALFAEMATCLFSAIVENPDAVRPAVEQRVEVAGADRDFLLFDWLKELLYRFDTEQWLLARSEVSVRGDGLSARVWGEPFDPARHVLSHEVKAITYHELKVEPVASEWLAEVIVDI